MGKASGLISYLSWEEMGQLHRAALSVLRDVGMKVDHPEALSYLAKAGSHVRRLLVESAQSYTEGQ